MAALRTTVRGAPKWEHLVGWLAAGAAAVSTFGLFLFVPDVEAQLLAAGAGLLGVSLMYLTTRGGRLVVGADGFSVLRIPGLPAFVSWADVERVRPATLRPGVDPSFAPRGIEIRLRDGKKLYLPRVPRREHVAREMTIRLNTFRGREASYATTLPERGDKSFAAWVDELERAASKTDYRTQPVTVAQLTTIAEDVDAPFDARAAAAVVACRVGTEDTTARVRVAADDVANPELAEALQRATRGKLSEV